jgi:hypothetical protein
MTGLDTLRRVFAVALGALTVAGCATLEPTTEQHAARAAWDRCPKAANIALSSIEPNGLVRYRASSSPAGSRDVANCLHAAGVSSLVVVATAP